MRRVIKLGGSLLDLPDWHSRLPRWLFRQPPATNYLVVGGGAMVDQMRETPALSWRLSTAQIHWLAIRAMAMQAECVLAFLPNARRLTDTNIPNDTDATVALWMVDAWHFMRQEEPLLPGPALPESWDVTSDSIAARFARAVDAHELVLLKSALPGDGTTRRLAVEGGYVDRCFALAAADLAVRCVNLLDPTAPELPLPP